MTMLADRLIQARGTEYDLGLGGMIGRIATKIEKAQRFAMNREATLATMQLLQARPSGMMKVMPVCRLPYQTMWIEADSGFGANTRDPKLAPVPIKQGTLIEAFGDRHGSMTVAWVHAPNHNDPDHHPNASPYSLYFDFREDGDAGVLASAFHATMLDAIQREKPALYPWMKVVVERMAKFNMPGTREGISEFMRNRSWWQKWSDDPHEIEALLQHDHHMRVGLSPNGLGGVMAALEYACAFDKPKMFADMMHSWEQDIAGEGPFAQFFIAMLNSKNCVEQEAVSMAKLNKARANRKSDKPPLLDYTTIKLVMSKARRRVAAARGLSPEITREQLVRGHFKTRRTGVFWWNEFERYKERGLEPSQRQRYEVRA